MTGLELKDEGTPGEGEKLSAIFGEPRQPGSISRCVKHVLS